MNRKQFRELILSKIVILDGATGTELIKRGMPQGVSPEKWILDNPDAIIDIQQRYRAAGSDIVYAPTFGGNRLKLEEFGFGENCVEINRDLAKLSRRAAGDGLVFADIAPTGAFIKPMGDMEFEDIVNIYKEQVKGLLEGGVDGFVVETMMDIQEARCAVIAIRESCDLPVMVTMTFDQNQRTLMGNDPLSALITMQSLGADAFGCNCSTGPEDMLEVIKKLKPYATIPLVAKPNAGLPKLINGETVFQMQPAEFGAFAKDFAQAGVNIIGGCCGSTPEHIRELATCSSKFIPGPPMRDSLSAISTARGYCLLGSGQPFAVIGERINPTGKKALQAELRAGSLNMVREFAQSQDANGAAVLDLNFGLSGIDEKTMMLEALTELSSTNPRPLCIDSVDPAVIEAALRVYPGRAIVNSISAEKTRIEQTLPIAAKYGAMFILLPLTDGGIPNSVEERAEVIQSIFAEAQKYGYHKEDLCVDALIMAVSSSPDAPKIALDLIRWCSQDFGVNTVCGLSNVSFGMPARGLINNTFLAMAMGNGLTMAIANPDNAALMEIVAAGDALCARDHNMMRFVGKYGTVGNVRVKTKDISETPSEKIFRMVVEGDEEGIPATIQIALDSGITAKSIMDENLIPAINKVGDLYDKKIYFLPQLMMSAETMRRGFQVLEPLLEKDSAGTGAKPVVVIATVEGDVHDIGKNIVALMLKNYGFEVVDLGKDVSAERIVNEAIAKNAALIGLSALMTTTMVRMKDVAELARARGINIPFMIGGAVVDRDYAEEIGAHYALDAMASVKIAKELTQSK